MFTSENQRAVHRSAGRIGRMFKRWSVFWLALTVLLAVPAVAQSTVPEPAAKPGVAEAQSVVVDGSSDGRKFDGIGGLAGTSKLLFDYPEPERGEILDYLFKPDYGASLDVLKITMGGDNYGGGNGSDPSHLPTRDGLTCDRGYEWWLMDEAKQRNPEIRFTVLPWAIPGWVGSVWTEDHAEYLVKWLDCAKRNGHEIDSIGGLNERTDGPQRYADWYVAFRQLLDDRGYADVDVVCCDHSEAFDGEQWKVAQVAAENPEFADAIDIMGVHSPVPCRFGEACLSSDAARGSGKSLQITELATSGGRTDAQHVADRARSYNRMYIDGRITGSNVWQMTTGWYSPADPAGGFASTNEPWSGHYDIKPVTWVTAHTTQFSDPGWRYLDSAVGDLSHGGSFVTLRSDDGDYSIIAETVEATTAQQVSFTVTDDLAAAPLQLWSSDLTSSQAEDYLVHEGELTPDGAGRFTAALAPGKLYTLSTTTGQGKGAATSPKAEPWPLPYHADFDQATLNQPAPLFNDTSGIFEIRECESHGQCLKQVTNTQPLAWGSKFGPNTAFGDIGWTDYSVSTRARLADSDWVELLAREQSPGRNGRQKFAYPGYHLRLAKSGQWELYREDRGNSGPVHTTLAAGQVTVDPDAFHELRLTVVDHDITAMIGGDQLAKVTDKTYRTGRVGLRVAMWGAAEFGTFEIDPA